MKLKIINMKIIPAILEKDYLTILKQLTKLVDLKQKYNLDFELVQIDIIDGVFVSNQTYDFDNLDEVEFEQVRLELINFQKYFEIEYHLMCEDQLKYFKIMADLEAKSVVIHIDDIDNQEIVEEIIDLAKQKYIGVIICAKLDYMEKYKLEISELLKNNLNINLQIMGIDKLGYQGESFDSKCLDLVKYFRSFQELSKLSIQIDGGVNGDSINEIKQSKVDKVVVGSYLMIEDEEDFVRNYKSLKI